MLYKRRITTERRIIRLYFYMAYTPYGAYTPYASMAYTPGPEQCLYLYMAYRLLFTWLTRHYSYMATWPLVLHGVHTSISTWLTRHYSFFGLDIGGTVVFTETPLFHRY